MAVALPVGFGFWFITSNWWVLMWALIICFFGTYLLFQFVLEWFIYRKIKLIYKFIYQTKANKREETYYKYILPQKSIDEVREDVEKWAEQRSAEIELLKTNEAYRKEFLQNLSHEFKTPIFAIQGYVDSLLGGAMENPDLSKRFLENAAKNVDRMVNLAEDLDEITRLESGEQPLTKVQFVIQDLIKEIYDTLSIKTAAKNIKTSIKKGCEAPVVVFADKEKIRQVINNLLENATKYGKQDGTIVASIYKTDGRHVLIEFSDDGIGIGEEHLPRIFERFYRTDRGRSRDVGGTGLGLAICKHIVEAHGETMHVRSKLDVGTTIGFTLEAKKD
ncbi:MAG: two-component sensor histidine kinase [Chitinophagaceae bacterium BSSC1]|nr:MAG: two-component sensor histidine kinase [Chitinophagaceae bacterium BSSC1]